MAQYTLCRSNRVAVSLPFGLLLNILKLPSSITSIMMTFDDFIHL